MSIYATYTNYTSGVFVPAHVYLFYLLSRLIVGCNRLAALRSIRWPHVRSLAPKIKADRKTERERERERERETERKERRREMIDRGGSEGRRER